MTPFWKAILHLGLSALALAAMGQPTVPTGRRLYVAVNGSDVGDGSARHPWATIQHAANLSRPNDIIVVRDGVYRETVAINRGGTPTEPILYMAEHRWGAKIAPSNTLGNSNYTMFFSHADYVTVSGFEITGTPTTSAGIKFDSGTHNSVIGNNIHDIGVSTETCTGGGAVLIADSYNRVEGNSIWNIGPPRNARFRCNQQHGVYLAGGEGGWIQNNLIYQVWQGVALHVHGRALSNWTITNNTIFNVGDNAHNTGGPMIFECLAGVCDYNLFNNNIFADTQGGYCWWEVQDPGSRLGFHNQYRNNLTYRCGSEIWVVGRAVDSIQKDPCFLSYTGGEGNYRLAPYSPARKRGTSSGAPSSDFDGKARRPSAGIDIGAFQSSEP